MTGSDVVDLLYLALSESDDRDTQTACVAVNSAGGYLYAANQLPHGVKTTEERITRPAKYTWIEHAERALIARAARIGFRLEGSTMYLNWFPCADCARALINAGIIKLVADRNAYESRVNDPRYYFAEAMTMLTEASVAVEWF